MKHICPHCQKYFRQNQLKKFVVLCITCYWKFYYHGIPIKEFQ